MEDINNQMHFLMQMNLNQKGDCCQENIIKRKCQRVSFQVLSALRFCDGRIKELLSVMEPFGWRTDMGMCVNVWRSDETGGEVFFFLSPLPFRHHVCRI